jgi:hypothetical protein
MIHSKMCLPRQPFAENKDLYVWNFVGRSARQAQIIVQIAPW